MFGKKKQLTTAHKAVVSCTKQALNKASAGLFATPYLHVSSGSTISFAHKAKAVFRSHLVI